MKFVKCGTAILYVPLWRCSACNKFFSEKTFKVKKKSYNYCPHCGVSYIVGILKVLDKWQ